jgi:hypothetical protein
MFIIVDILIIVDRSASDYAFFFSVSLCSWSDVMMGDSPILCANFSAAVIDVVKTLCISSQQELKAGSVRPGGLSQASATSILTMTFTSALRQPMQMQTITAAQITRNLTGISKLPTPNSCGQKSKQ